MQNLFADAKKLVEKAKENPEAVQKIAKQAEDGFKKGQEFFAKLAKGDVKAAEVQLTEWEDVNELNKATAEVEALNAAGPGLKFSDVVGVVGKVAQIVFALGKAVL